MSDDRRRPASDRKAFDFLQSELLEKLLSISDNPGKSSDFLAEELRALIGAKTVIVFQCRLRSHSHIHRAVSVYPERRKALAEKEELEKILELSHSYTNARLIGEEKNEEATLLSSLGIGVSMLVPLSYGGERVGAITLLDLFDRDTAEKVLDVISRLSTIFALILRNADLYANMEEQVAERTRALENSVKEKEALLREVHHRVKNNLQIVLGFLYLKSSGPVGEETRCILEETQERVYSMALAHEELYRGSDLASIDMADYLQRIVENILNTSCPATKREYKMANLRLDMKRAVPCGLIVSELVMNSTKHAFLPLGGGSLTLSVGIRGKDAFVDVADDGPGFPDKNLMTDDKGGIGMSIIGSLLGQLRGTLELSEPGPGARARLTFKM